MLFESFTYPLIGGVLIGISATLFLLFNGRIAGVSGIYWRAMASMNASSVIFILGLPLGAWLFHFIAQKPAPAANESYLYACIGGVLVGMGVKLGSGCTSGHGVCGIGRLSKRSIVATAIFMSAGIATVFLLRQVL